MQSCNDNNDSTAFILNAVLVSIVLARNLTPAEQNLLGTFLQEVGGNLSSMSTYDIFFEAIAASNAASKVGPNIK